jgi:hypothetical protein
MSRNLCSARLRLAGPRLEITEGGRALALSARQTLQLDDQAMDRFARKPPDGVLQVALPTDYAHAHARRTARDLSQGLLDDLRRDELDIVIAMTCEGCSNIWRASGRSPCCAAAKFWTANPVEPVG